MILLDQEIENAKAERSLLMAFAASPSHLETGILRALQQHGDGRVTVLVDHSQYRAAFTEVGVRGPGVHYRYYPVRLPRPAAAFHAKLYLLAGSDAATLLVASANLTRAGWRRNAEVVDRITIERGGGGDSRAFASYVALLEALATSTVDLSEPARVAIGDEVTRLRDLLGDAPDLRDGPRFLHNLERPLLDQIREIVPADAITEITVISPYFDPGNLALRALAAAYPKARQVRVIKNEEELNNFAGDAAAGLRRRLKLFYVRSVGGTERYVHAKGVFLSGPQGTWAVAGSANATAAAWLRVAVSADGSMRGNLEAVTVRYFSSPRVARDFCAPLEPLEEVKDWHELEYEAPAPAEPTEDAAVPEPGIPVLDAEISDGALVIRMAGAEWARRAISASVVVEDTAHPEAGRHTFEAVVEIRAGGRAEITIPLGRHELLERREPATVTVEVALGEGAHISGRAWLMRPTLIDTPAPQREFEYATDAFSRRPFHGGSQYEALLAGLLELLVADAAHDAAVGEVEVTRIRGGGRSGGGNGDDATGPTGGVGVRPEELIVDETDPRVVFAALGQGPRSLLERVHGAMEQLFRVPETDADDLDEDRIEGGDATHGRRRPTHLTTEPGDRIPRLKTADVTRAHTLLRDLAHHLAQVLDDKKPVVRRRLVARGLWLFEKLAAAVLPSLYLQARDENRETLEELGEIVHGLWCDAWSLDGAAYGKVRGWIPRALLDPELAPTVRRVTASPTWWARVIASFAACLTTLHRINATRFLPGGAFGGTVAGLRFASGVDDLLRHPTLAANVHERIAAYAARSDGLIAESDVRELLTEITAHPFQLVDLAARWWPVVRYCDALRSGRDVTSSEAAVRVDGEIWTKLQRLRRRFPSDPAASVSFDNDQAVCRGCFENQSRVQSSLLRARPASLHDCEVCGRLLIPFDFAHGHTAALLEHLMRVSDAAQTRVDSMTLGEPPTAAAEPPV